MLTRWRVVGNSSGTRAEWQVRNLDDRGFILGPAPFRQPDASTFRHCFLTPPTAALHGFHSISICPAHFQRKRPIAGDRRDAPWRTAARPRVFLAWCLRCLFLPQLFRCFPVPSCALATRKPCRFESNLGRQICAGLLGSLLAPIKSTKTGKNSGG